MMKRFRKGLLTALLSLAALGSHADRLYVEDMQVLAGSDCGFDVILESADMSQYCAYQYDLLLPQGVTASRDDFKMYADFYTDAQQSFSIEQLPGGAWRVVCLSPTNMPMKGQTGPIMRILAKGDGSQKEGVSSVTLKNIVFTKLMTDGSTQTVRMPEYSFSVTAWREATVTARSYTRRYGEPNPTFEYDVTGDQLQGTPLLTCDATATTAVGTYDIRVSQGTVKNPYVTYIPGKLTIVSASSALVFDPVSKIYGDASFTVSPKTDVSGGAITYSSGNMQVVTVSGQTFTIVGAGTATITANQAATANYGATSTTFTVSVAQREAVLGWSNLSFTYDGQSHVPTASVTNLVGSDFCNVTVSGAQTNVGNYTATATALSNANYKLPAACTQAFTITSASSALVFDPVSKTYGDASFTVSPKTDVSGGAITYSSGNTQVVTVSGQTFTIVGAGTATITANQAVTANYGATSTTFTVSVALAPLTIAAGNYTKQQGDPMPEWKASYKGFVNGETETVLTRQPEFHCDADENSAPGSYVVTVSDAEARNYAITYQPGILTVTQADEIVVMATDCSREYGEQNPVLTYTVSGGTLQGEPEIFCDVYPFSPVNGYAIVVRRGSVTNPNVTFVNGTLTVTKAPLTIYAGSYTIEQGEPMPQFIATYEGFKLDDTERVLTTPPTISCAADPSFPPGRYPVRIDGAEARNYSITHVDGELTIVESSGIAETSVSAHSGAVWFTTDGRRLDGRPVGKGLYIMNGRKVVVR